jgi:hypothetical protein
MYRYDGPVRAYLGAGLVVAVVASGARARAEDPAGHFVATANMHLARDGARAVLVDRNVLVIGGENYLEGPLRSAEMWRDGDKGDASWTEAGRMQVPRVGHTVTALGDGRVLVVGGGGSNPSARLAEIWGEDDGVHDLPMFRPAGRLSVGRRFHSATLLPDGRVLVIGGRDPQDRPLATAELWEPKRRVWSAAGRLHLGRCCHTATLLDDGRVLVAGGRVKHDDPEDCEDDRANHRVCTTTTDSVEIWDPRTRRFSEGPNLATGGNGTDFSDRAAHTATRLTDGRVLIMGGAGASEPDPLALRRPTAYLWDQPSHHWAEVSGMPRDYHTATLLPNGSVLIVGGALDFCGCCKPVHRPGPAPAINDAWVWIPASGKLVGAGRAVHSRMNHTAVLLPDGRVLIAGGTVPNDETDDGQGRTSASAEIWQPAP